MTADVVVVGGGVIGSAIAWAAARRGLRVVVLERDRPGAGASWAAAGMLSPQAEAAGPGPMLELLLEARALYPATMDALREATGADPSYCDAGTLYVALTAADEAELDARFAWQRAAGLDVERLDAAAALRAEPALAPGVTSALRFPGDHQVDNRILAGALWDAAAGAGAACHAGRAAVALLHSGGRVTGVRCAGGERIAARAVVLAGGVAAGSLAGLPRPLPLIPVRGQLLAIGAAPPPFRHVVDSPRCYLVPRATGRVVVGATVERTGERAVTPWGMGRLLAGALEIAPSLEHAPIDEVWSGIRPGTPDDLPILGPDPEVDGLVYATGHFRNGILLAPLTGERTAALLAGEGWPSALAPFGVGRFGGR